MREKLFHWFALACILITAGWLRFTGLLWGEFQYQHPDERFLIWVVSDLKAVPSLGAYFDTAASTLNPANRGHRFFVYGTLPVFAARYLADAFYPQDGWAGILRVGRAISASSDLLTVLLVYLAAGRLLARRLALLAALFSVLSVLPVQQAHFFTVDAAANTFIMLAITCAIWMLPGGRAAPAPAGLWLPAAFGAATGLAMACKLTAFPVAFLLPAAVALNWLRTGRNAAALPLALRSLVVGGLAAVIVFRIFQPYAFAGPTFFHVSIDPGWLSAIREQRAQAAGDIDFPPALQWARRPLWFSFANLTVWGLGLPLGLAAWGGLVGMAVCFAKRAFQFGWAALLPAPWPARLLLWGWTAVYFGWQSLAWNPTMRYQLPVYPALAVLAAWGVGALAQLRWKHARAAARMAGGLAAVFTLAWALAFVQIYQRPETRQAASRWMYENIPGPVNLEIEQDGAAVRQLLPVEEGMSLRLDASYRTTFITNQAGWLSQIDLPYTRILAGDDPELDARIVARVLDPDSWQPLAASIARLSELSPSGRAEMIFDPLWLEEGRRYGLELRLVSLGGALLFHLDGPIRIRTYATQALVEEGAYDGLISSPAAGTLRRVRLVVVHPPPVLPERLVVRSVTGEVRVARLLSTPGATAPLLTLDPPVAIEPGAIYLTTLEGPSGAVMDGIRYHVQLLDEPVWQSLPPPVRLVQERQPVNIAFRAGRDGLLRSVTLWRTLQEDPLAAEPAELRLTLISSNRPAVPLYRDSRFISQAEPGQDPRGTAVTFRLEPPLPLAAAQMYVLRLEVPGQGTVAVRGSAPANESDWDMALPFRAMGYDPFRGLYQRGLNLQLYWEDSVDKLLRLGDTLDQADVIVISSNRQWGSITRMPERYPLTTEYYRLLLGCPPDRDVAACYRTAEVGDYEGALGFDLAQVFTSYPNLGPLRINTQFAEEAFSVYDHPKVWIFQKREDYDPDRVQALLRAVDLDTVVNHTPNQAASWSSLLLPASRWAGQRAGGTWAQLFPPASALNRSPLLAAAAWWGFLALVGWLAYPLALRAMPGLPDGAYPLARAAGLLLLAYPVWLAGSLGIAVSKGLILAGLLGLVAANLGLVWRDRRRLRAHLTRRAGYFLCVELLALAGFLAFLAVRGANPDLWHVIFGGEKPMDFAYFNAVLKSSTYPPYDPWFAGGLMNYYYYGFVIYGLPVKLLGITPAVAYNLLLAAVFSLTVLGAFSLGWNLFAASQNVQEQRASAWRAGLLAALALAVMGNQGTVRMVWQGWQRLAAGEQQIAASSFGQRAAFAWQGLQEYLAGRALPYYPGDWYWIPSRAIQAGRAGEITEYPLFSFLYGDPHAHLLALPVTLLALGWAFSTARGAGWRGWNGGTLLTLGLGALIAGSLRAANSWDQPTYLAVMLAAVGYAGWQQARSSGNTMGWRRLAAYAPPVLFAVFLLALSAALFWPFEHWFRPGYNQVRLWSGAQTDLGSYLVHWGLFIYAFSAWAAVEIVAWMAATPYAALRRLRPYQPYFALVGLALGGVLLMLVLRGVQVAWVVIPLGAAAAGLLLRPHQPAAKRAVLFLAGCGLALTLAVELAALQGDRMNTVFKFYFQAWTMLSISAAVGLAWVLPVVRGWKPGWRWAWLVGLGVLAAGAALNTLTAARAKIADRMAPEAARWTLDGMAFMEYARMVDGPPGGEAAEMDLAQDYRAIRWMQTNVTGSPVIVEMHTGEYRHWGSRFTIYTGLPGVTGWENHQRQQRPAQGDWITHRIQDVREFYLTSDRQQAVDFLRRYQVEYIIVGQLERIYAPGPGLRKFRALEGIAWQRVYADGDTEIYRVLP